MNKLMALKELVKTIIDLDDGKVVVISFGYFDEPPCRSQPGFLTNLFVNEEVVGSVLLRIDTIGTLKLYNSKSPNAVHVFPNDILNVIKQHLIGEWEGTEGNGFRELYREFYREIELKKDEISKNGEFFVRLFKEFLNKDKALKPKGFETKF